MARERKKANIDEVKTFKHNPKVRVKNSREVMLTIQNFLAYNLHDRYNFGFSKTTQKKIVAYGPWLAAATIFIILPELMTLAKSGGLISPNGFIETILFNQSSWVILIIIFINIMLIVDGMKYIFDQLKRGWNSIYFATLISSIYIIWQLFTTSGQPASSLLALMGCYFILFTLFDIKKYYN